MSNNVHILFLGKRFDAILAAKKLNIKFSIIHDRKILKQRSYFEIQIKEDSPLFLDCLKKLPKNITHVIPVTEYGVRIFERVLKHLKIKNDITNNITACFNKVEMKKLALKSKIKITPYLVLDKWDTKKIIKKVGTNIVVKECASSGSRGQTYLNTSKEISNFKIKETAIVEKKIIGEEFSIESFVENKKIVFSNITKYQEHHTCNVLPYKPTWYKKALILNEKVIKAFGIKTGMVHIEYYKKDNDILFGEIAIRPPGGYIMKLLELSYGIKPWELIIEISLKTHGSISNLAKFYSACWILYPNVEILKKLPKFKAIEKDPSIVDIKSALTLGPVPKRNGSGEDFGRILLKNTSNEQLIKSIKNLKKESQILLGHLTNKL